MPRHSPCQAWTMKESFWCVGRPMCPGEAGTGGKEKDNERLCCGFREVEGVIRRERGGASLSLTECLLQLDDEDASCLLWCFLMETSRDFALILSHVLTGLRRLK